MKKIALLSAALMLVSVFASCLPKGDLPVSGEPVVVDVDAQSRVAISELMADNAGFFMNCFDDWVELRNEEDRDIPLSGYVLGKMKKGSAVMRLDEYTLPAGGFLVIRLNDTTPFRLGAEGESVVLYYGQNKLDELTYNETIGQGSWTHEGACETPTPGFANTAAGFEEYMRTVSVPGLRINEVISSNSSLFPKDGEFYDMVEIYNGTGETVRLGEYFLSDKKSEPKRYSFPDIELPAGGFYLVYCGAAGGGEDCASFKISSAGETVYLSRGDEFVDCMRVPGDVPGDHSWGRTDDGFAYFAEPTMGSENSTGYMSVVAAPKADFPTGEYDEAFDLNITGEGTVYYTTDGSEPNEASKVWQGPMHIDGVVSIRAVCISDGRRSEEARFFYLANIGHTLPVIDIAIKQSDLTGNKGVLNHIDPEYEHGALATMMENGEVVFSVPCGFKLHGNDSKKGKKQNFQLRFRAIYGMSKLKCSLFDSRETDTFNSLILKGGSEDYVFCNFRDELAAALTDKATGLSVQAYRPVILYLDGEYWGVYWLRERIDAEYCAQKLGVSKDSVTLLKDYGEAAVTGSAKDFGKLCDYAANHDLKNKADYDYVMSRIDSVSMMDWYICRGFMGDSDLANMRVYSSSEADGRWHWCFFDLDWSFWLDTEDPIGRTARNDGHHKIIVALLKNPDFRKAFLERTAFLLRNVLNEERVISTADELADMIRTEMPRDREKLGYTMEQWESNIKILKDYVRGGARLRTFLAGVKSYFGLTDSEMKGYFGDMYRG